MNCLQIPQLSAESSMRLVSCNGNRLSTCSARPQPVFARKWQRFSTPKAKHVQKVQAFDGLKSFISPQQGPGVSAERTPPMVPLEDDTSVINSEEEGQPFGPLAIILVGFMDEEVQRVRGFLASLEAQMVKVIPVTKAMMQGTVGAALQSEPPAYEQPPLGTRRAIMLSGMYGAEIVSVIEGYNGAGLPPAVFACAVPNSYGRVLGEVLEECHEDHAWHMRKEKEGDLNDDQP